MKTLDEIKQTMAGGDTAKAAEALKEVLAKEPTNLQAKMLYGTCCQLLGDEETFSRIHDELAHMMIEQKNKSQSINIKEWKKSDLFFGMMRKYDVIIHYLETVLVNVGRLFAILMLGTIGYLMLTRVACVDTAYTRSGASLTMTIAIFLGLMVAIFFIATFLGAGIEWFVRRNSYVSGVFKCVPKVASGSKHDSGTCWICGSKCKDEDAVFVKLDGGQVQYEEQHFFFTKVHRLWPTATVNVPCCPKCRKDIKLKSRILNVVSFFALFATGAAWLVIGVIVIVIVDGIAGENVRSLISLVGRVGIVVGAILSYSFVLGIRSGANRYWHGRKIMRYPDIRSFVSCEWKFCGMLFEKEMIGS